MALSSEHYIRLCKEQIEERYFLVDDGGGLNRNLEILSRKIEEKTGVLISLSTLKRVWRKDYKQKPQVATLNALAALLDYDDWEDFIERNQVRAKSVSGMKVWIPVAILAAVAVVVTIILLLQKQGGRSDALIIKGDIDFNAKKTEYTGVPTTVIFAYNVLNVEADSFSFQQSWNDQLRIRIDPEGKAISSIYYESGYHRAKLFANNLKIAELPIHILSDGWESHLYYSDRDRVPIDIPAERTTGSGEFHISREALEEQQVDLSKPFYSRIVKSQAFEVSSDNFTLSSRLKVDSMGISQCPWINIIVVMEVHIFSVRLSQKGCEHLAYYKMGEVQRDGRENDLSAMGCDLYDWQEVDIRVQNRNAVIRINGQDCFTEKYEEDYKDITALIFSFEGVGSIDYVRLTDGYGHDVLKDQFDQ